MNLEQSQQKIDSEQVQGLIQPQLHEFFHQVLRETCGKQLEAKNQELVERDEQISELTNQVDKDILPILLVGLSDKIN